MLVKQRVSSEEVDTLIKAIMLGQPIPSDVKPSDLSLKQLEYIKTECYRNLGSMLSMMQLLDNYLKDKITERE